MNRQTGSGYSRLSVVSTTETTDGVYETDGPVNLRSQVIIIIIMPNIHSFNKMVVQCIYLVHCILSYNMVHPSHNNFFQKYSLSSCNLWKGEMVSKFPSSAEFFVNVRMKQFLTRESHS